MEALREDALLVDDVVDLLVNGAGTARPTWPTPPTDTPEAPDLTTMDAKLDRVLARLDELGTSEDRPPR